MIKLRDQRNRRSAVGSATATKMTVGISRKRRAVRAGGAINKMKSYGVCSAGKRNEASATAEESLIGSKRRLSRPTDNRLHNIAGIPRSVPESAAPSFDVVHNPLGDCEHGERPPGNTSPKNKGPSTAPRPWLLVVNSDHGGFYRQKQRMVFLMGSRAKAWWMKAPGKMNIVINRRSRLSCQGKLTHRPMQTNSGRRDPLH